MARYAIPKTEFEKSTGANADDGWSIVDVNGNGKIDDADRFRPPKKLDKAQAERGWKDRDFQEARAHYFRSDYFGRLNAKRDELEAALDPKKTLKDAATQSKIATPAKSSKKASTAKDAKPPYEKLKPVIEQQIREIQEVAKDTELPPDILSDNFVHLASFQSLIATEELRLRNYNNALEMARQAGENLRKATALQNDNAWAWSSLGEGLLGFSQQIPSLLQSYVCGKLGIKSFSTELNNILPGMFACQDSVRCQVVALTICAYLDKKGQLSASNKQQRSLAAARVEKWRSDPAMKKTVEDEEKLARAI